ncbi:unnamed protein product [Chrysoparadoxa australica]
MARAEAQRQRRLEREQHHRHHEGNADDDVQTAPFATAPARGGGVATVLSDLSGSLKGKSKAKTTALEGLLPAGLASQLGMVSPTSRSGQASPVGLQQYPWDRTRKGLSMRALTLGVKNLFSRTNPSQGAAAARKNLASTK